MSDKKLTWEAISELLGYDFTQRLKAQHLMDSGIESSDNYFQKLLAIKKYWEGQEPALLEHHYKNPLFFHQSYPYDWSRIFTPIELHAWQCIRAKGRIVLYPQYPVLKYHLDFGNPGFRIGLELDGKEWHNKEKDRIRDFDLALAGWNIYRITGQEMMRTNFMDLSELEDDWLYHEDVDQTIEHIRYWLMETGDGVIQAIKEVYFDPAGYTIVNEEVMESYRSYCYKTLENHQFQ